MYAPKPIYAPKILERTLQKTDTLLLVKLCSCDLLPSRSIFCQSRNKNLSQIMELMFFSENTLLRRVRALLDLFLGDRLHVLDTQHVFKLDNYFAKDMLKFGLHLR